MADKSVYSNPDERRPEILAEIESRVKVEIIPEIDKFEDWSSMPRIFFRISGTVTIILSISLPLLSIWEEGETMVPVVATAIALLTAFSTFFSWDQTWKTNYTTALLLRNALAAWKAKMLRAKYHPDPEAGIEIAHEAYEVLIGYANNITAQNTNTYFSHVKPPDVTSRK